MGNCTGRESGERLLKEDDKDQDQPQNALGDDDNGVSGNKGGKVRMKVVLTKAELEWLILSLKDNGGGDQGKGKRLKEVLEDMGRGRGRVYSNRFEEASCWKPCLDSVMEIPEVPDE